MSEKRPQLYIVATPIGNLEDITHRAVRILSEADCIACEDTRRTLAMLNSFNIKNRLISYHEHSDERKIRKIIDMLDQGKSIALVSDAGTPLISDPGFDLINAAIESGYDVTPIPGACAGIAAVTVSGMNASQFVFVGFLPKKNKALNAFLQDLREQERTMVFYEAPHRLTETLKKMLEIFGDRLCSVSREMTKLHEQTLRGALSKMLEHFEETKPIGEFTITIEGAKNSHVALDDGQIAEELEYRLSLGMTKSAAVKSIAHEYGINRNRVYHVSLNRL